MEGVTSALVLFVFVCVLFPRLIDSRPQYYIGFGLTLICVLLTGFLYRHWVVGVVLVIAQVGAILTLFLSAGGLTVRGLTREMASAFEVIRRGQKDKEVIIPIGQEQKEKRQKSAVESMGEPIERFDLSAEEGDAAYPAKITTPPKKDDGPIPMD